MDQGYGDSRTDISRSRPFSVLNGGLLTCMLGWAVLVSATIAAGLSALSPPIAETICLLTLASAGLLVARLVLPLRREVASVNERFEAMTAAYATLQARVDASDRDRDQLVASVYDVLKIVKNGDA